MIVLNDCLMLEGSHNWQALIRGSNSSQSLPVAFTHGPKKLYFGQTRRWQGQILSAYFAAQPAVLSCTRVQASFMSPLDNVGPGHDTTLRCHSLFAALDNIGPGHDTTLRCHSLFAALDNIGPGHDATLRRWVLDRGREGKGRHKPQDRADEQGGFHCHR